jgi:Asp-tRNA(Asn)/Glu-tRNA(Gln) amidotransferase A subunit family amidase
VKDENKSGAGAGDPTWSKRRQLLRATVGVPAAAEQNSADLGGNVASASATSPNDVLELTSAEAIAHIRDGSMKAEQYAGQLLKTYRDNQDLNAFTWIDEDRVLESARAVDVARSQGKVLGRLAGLPVCIKDNIATLGFPTSAGTPALRNAYPNQNAPVVERLLEQGAIVLAKANMHEMARGTTSSNPAFGAVKNPYDRSRIPGGSSGGVAAAIAARMVSAGLGSDTGGSTRIPASMCGIVGLRPSIAGARRMYAAEGVVPIALSVDTVGPMGRTVADVALLHGVITGTEMPRPAVLRGVRIGLPQPGYWEDLDPEVERLTKVALAKLRDDGVTVLELDLGDFADAVRQLFMVLVEMHALADLREYLAAHAPGVSMEELIGKVAGRDVRAMFNAELAHPVPAEKAIEAINVLRPKLQRQYESFFRQHKLTAIAFPTVAVTALPIRPGGDTANDTISLNGKQVGQFATTVRNTITTSALGVPGITLPAGISAHGLPVGLEFDALAGKDSELLALGLSVEEVYGHLPPPK